MGDLEELLQPQQYLTYLDGDDLYPYYRIEDEVSKQTKNMSVSHHIIIGIALGAYCKLKLSHTKRHKIPLGTTRELEARNLILNEDIEVMVSSAIRTYNIFLKDTPNNQDMIKQSYWQALFNWQRISFSCIDTIVASVGVFIMYLVFKPCILWLLGSATNELSK